MADEPLTQHMSLSNLHWIAAVMPDRGWDNRTGLYLTAGLGAFALALLLSVLLFQSLNAHTRIREESIVDHLTGLYNRRFLEEYQILLLGRAARNDSKVAILMIDLDRFKTINDRYGHKAGDELLKAVCERMRTVCRATEALFRLGGDEFLILFPDVNDMTFMPAIIDRLREVIAKPVIYAGHALQVEPSIGLAMYPDHGTTLDALMQHADRRMYEEKDVHRQASVPPMNGSDTPK